MNTIHFGMQAVFSKAIVYFWSERFQPTVTMSWKDYFMRVVPTAIGTAPDINLSNASLVFILVTFASMCKSAATIFLLILSFAFRLESPSFKLLGIMLIISAGVLLTGGSHGYVVGHICPEAQVCKLVMCCEGMWLDLFEIRLQMEEALLSWYYIYPFSVKEDFMWIGECIRNKGK
ncbi:hypothetical protein Hdeb2414_s0058g00759061 [Helianthus debilis subsp. tardiflorus]